MNEADSGAMRKRSVVVAGHRTSVSLENAFWTALKELARARGLTVNQLIAEIDGRRGGNLSSAIRVHVLRAVRGDAADDRPTERAAADTPAKTAGISGKGPAAGP